MFVNANSDPKKHKSASPSDFFFFVSEQSKNFTSPGAETFFSLAKDYLIPHWVMPHIPLKELAKARKAEKAKPMFPRAWVSDKVFLVGPKVKGNKITFSFALVTELFCGQVDLMDLDTNYRITADIPEQPHENTLIIDGDFELVGD